jgi:CelD/BcsL family acetyltransferase involved in cellulose biosynthesis
MTTVTTLAVSELGPDTRARWATFRAQDSRLASPFLGPDFVALVGAARADVRVAVVEDDGQAVAFLPFQRDGLFGGQPVGAPLADCHGPVVAPGLEWSPLEVVAKAGLAVWSFDHLPLASAALAPFVSGTDDSPCLDLSAGFEAYAARRRTAGSAIVEKTARQARKLAREVGPLRFEAASTDISALAAVLGWKALQYRRTGREDLFARPWVREVAERVHRHNTTDSAGALSLLFSGERLVAGHLGLRSRSVWHWWFPAYDPVYATYSPGLVLLLEMARAAADQGVGTVDLGRGADPYKARFATGAVPLAQGRIEVASWRLTVRRQSLRARVRLRRLARVAAHAGRRHA